jgi:cyclopropane fatty-acyl-phospholipid synthase-like methyltransferase
MGSEEEDQIYDVVDGKTVYRTMHQVSTLCAKIEIPAGATVLDYGSAKGATIRELARARPDIVPHLYDVSDMYIPFWQKFAKRQNWATHTLNNDWGSRFDVVTSFFSLEHIVDIRDAVEKIAWLLNADGVFYGIVPNVFTNTADFVVVDHVNHFTKASLKTMLVAGGFTAIDIDTQVHRGAFVVVARREHGCHVARPTAQEVAAELARAAQTATYWRDLVERLRAYERRRSSTSCAVYGAGFYGAFIATTLARPEYIRCFLDQSLYLQGHVFFGKPVLPPQDLPEDVDTLFVGLNPSHARRSMSEIAFLKNRELDYFYCD